MASGFERALASKRAVVFVIAFIMLLSARSIQIGFLTDDHSFKAMVSSTSDRAPAAWDLFRFQSGDLEGNQLRIRYGRLPWWAAPDLKIHFLRPLTSLAFVADTQLFADQPIGYHLHSLLWYLLLLIAAAILFRRLLPPAAATLALAIFGLSAAHVEAYAWVSARHVVIAAAFATAALAARWSQRRWLGYALLVVALASSEAALAVIPLWIALDLARSSPWRARLLAAAPAVALAVAYLAIYAILGCGTRGSDGYHDPMSDPLGFVALAIVRIPILLGDAALGIPAELAFVLAPWKLALAGLAAVAIVALGWRLTRPAASVSVAPAEPPAPAAIELSGRTLAWLCLGGLGGCVLGAAGYPSGRVLMLPNLAFTAILGLILYRSLAAAWPGKTVAAVLALAHLIVAPLATQHEITRLTHRARATEAIAAQIVALAPPSGRLFAIGASDPMVFLYPRGITADTAPGAVRCWSVLSAAHSGHRLTRTDRHTLTIEALDRPLLDHSFDALFRAPDRPFAVGDTAEQCGATFTVTAVTSGLPTKLSVTLRRSLDDPELAWIAWNGAAFVPLTLPAIGQPVDVRWEPGPSGAL